MLFKKLLLTASGIAAVLASVTAAEARDQIRIVGSSTVYPFTTAVAENFGQKTGMKTPIVESTGTGGGMKLFCAGIGADHPDITNASRRIKKGEFEDCNKNGVSEIIELNIGFDGLTIAHSKNGPPACASSASVRKSPVSDASGSRPSPSLATAPSAIMS